MRADLRCCFLYGRELPCVLGDGAELFERDLREIKLDIERHVSPPEFDCLDVLPQCYIAPRLVSIPANRAGVFRGSATRHAQDRLMITASRRANPFPPTALHPLNIPVPISPSVTTECIPTRPIGLWPVAVSSRRGLPGVENRDDVVGDLPGGVGTGDAGQTLGHQPAAAAELPASSIMCGPGRCRAGRSLPARRASARCRPRPTDRHSRADDRRRREGRGAGSPARRRRPARPRSNRRPG